MRPDEENAIEENPFENVTRVEVIDGLGRSYVNWNKNNSVGVSIQDEGRTLKVFIQNKINNK